MDGIAPLEKVAALNAQAAVKGIYSGMSKVEASRFPELLCIPRSTADETFLKNKVLQFALRFTPLVEDASHADGCTLVLDIAASLTIFGDAEVIGRQLLSDLMSIRLKANISVSKDFHTAVLTAQSRSAERAYRFIPGGMERKSLELLPISMLPLTEDQSSILATWGIRTFKEFAALPLTDLIARLGQPAKILYHLARGNQSHNFVPVVMPSAMTEKFDCDAPVDSVDSLVFLISALLRKLVERVQAALVLLASVSISFGLESQQSHSRTIRPSLPTNDTKIFLKLIHLDLMAHPPRAGVMTISITGHTGSSREVQLDLYSPQLPAAGSLDITLARIDAIVGEGHAGTPQLIDGHSQDAFLLTRFSISGHTPAPLCRHTVRVGYRRLRPAYRIRVQVKDDIPTRLRTNTGAYCIELAYGPWIVSYQWWSPEIEEREDWDISAREINTNDVMHCCISLRRSQRCWYLDGIYD